MQKRCFIMHDWKIDFVFLKRSYFVWICKQFAPFHINIFHSFDMKIHGFNKKYMIWIEFKPCLKTVRLLKWTHRIYYFVWYTNLHSYKLIQCYNIQFLLSNKLFMIQLLASCIHYTILIRYWTQKHCISVCLM